MAEPLEAGRSYLFRHKRKGDFEAVFMGYEEDADTTFLRVAIDTSEGSGRERFANAYVYIDGRKTTPLVSEKLLRPELVLEVSPVG